MVAKIGYLGAGTVESQRGPREEGTTIEPKMLLGGLDAKIADLASTIDQLAKEIAALQAEVAEMQKQLKRAGEDREKENADFQTTVADQRATQALLTKALDVLKGVYAKKELMQIRSRQEPAGPPPPPGFKKSPPARAEPRCALAPRSRSAATRPCPTRASAGWRCAARW